MASVAPGKQIAGYTVLAQIGTGAASELYAVSDPKSKQVWALKQVHKTTDKDQRFLDQCEGEYLIGSKLEHPNIRRVIKLIKNRKMFKVTDYVLIMELVDAMSLDKRLPRNYQAAVDVFYQAAEGLLHMHDRGYVHADIKPSNVLVSEKGDVKIIDLGQSCPIGTVKKRIQGTPGYMAPEQAHRRAVDAKTDIYNLGATMYWVLVREVVPSAMPPRSQRTENGKNGSLVKTSATKIETDIDAPVPPHERNPRIHPMLSKLVMDCVELDPAKRPDSMKDVVDRLSLLASVLDTQPESERERSARSSGNDD
ncbi:MAG: serine/threonine-protein kinase [Phycisphaerales bacterium]